MWHSSLKHNSWLKSHSGQLLLHHCHVFECVTHPSLHSQDSSCRTYDAFQYTSEFCTLDTVALKNIYCLAQECANECPAVSFGSSDPCSHQRLHNTQTDTTCGKVDTLDASPLLLLGFHQIGLELMRRYATRSDRSGPLVFLGCVCSASQPSAGGGGKKDAIVAQASRKLRETPFAFIS